MPRFELTNTELFKATQFKSKHKKCPYNKAMRKFINTNNLKHLEPFPKEPHYTLFPTGIGVAITYTCGCGESVDLTDYDIW